MCKSLLAFGRGQFCLMDCQGQTVLKQGGEPDVGIEDYRVYDKHVWLQFADEKNELDLKDQEVVYDCNTGEEISRGIFLIGIQRNGETTHTANGQTVFLGRPILPKRRELAA